MTAPHKAPCVCGLFMVEPGERRAAADGSYHALRVCLDAPR